MTKNERIDDLILNLEEELLLESADTDRYKILLERLNQVVDIRDKKMKSPWLDPKLLVPVAGSLVSILLVLNYENLHVIGGKAINFVPKVKM